MECCGDFAKKFSTDRDVLDLRVWNVVDMSRSLHCVNVVTALMSSITIDTHVSTRTHAGPRGYMHVREDTRLSM